MCVQPSSAKSPPSLPPPSEPPPKHPLSASMVVRMSVPASPERKPRPRDRAGEDPRVLATIRRYSPDMRSAYVSLSFGMMASVGTYCTCRGGLHTGPVAPCRIALRGRIGVRERVGQHPAADPGAAVERERQPTRVRRLGHGARRNPGQRSPRIASGAATSTTPEAPSTSTSTLNTVPRSSSITACGSQRSGTVGTVGRVAASVPVTVSARGKGVGWSPNCSRLVVCTSTSAADTTRPPSHPTGGRSRGRR